MALVVLVHLRQDPKGLVPFLTDELINTCLMLVAPVGVGLSYFRLRVRVISTLHLDSLVIFQVQIRRGLVLPSLLGGPIVHSTKHLRYVTAAVFINQEVGAQV